MRNLVAGFLALMGTSVVGVLIFLGIAAAIYGHPDKAPPAFEKFATACLVPLGYWFAVLAYRKPESFYGGIRSIIATAQQLVPLETLLTPHQRVFFLVLIGGLVLSIGTPAVYFIEGNSSFIQYVVLQRGFGEEDYMLAFYGGITCVVIGLLGSFFYAQTYGRIISWIKYG